MGDLESCELCDGTGSVIAEKPMNFMESCMRCLVLESRYARGLPLFFEGDMQNPSSIGKSMFEQFMGIEPEPTEVDFTEQEESGDWDD